MIVDAEIAEIAEVFFFSAISAISALNSLCVLHSYPIARIEIANRWHCLFTRDSASQLGERAF